MSHDLWIISALGLSDPEIYAEFIYYYMLHISFLSPTARICISKETGDEKIRMSHKYTFISFHNNRNGLE